MSAGTSGLDWWRDQLLREAEQRRREAEQRRIAREQYPWNVRLLAVVVVGGMLWYYWHVEPMIAGTIILGTPLTVWALFKFGQSWLPRDRWYTEGRSAISQRVLAHPRARRYLCVAAGVVAVLLVTTTSVYLEYDESEAQGDYLIEVYRGEHLLMAPQRVTSYNSRQGRTYFLNITWLFNPWDLTVRVKQPPYRYDTARLSIQLPWPYRLRVPTAFDVKHYRVFRLLPEGDEWMKLSTRTDDPNDSFFRLQAWLPCPDGSEKRLFETPFFFEPVYFGGSAEMIAHFQQLERESGDHRWNVVGHLQKKYANDKPTFQAQADLMMMVNETICETQQIADDATLVIRVLRQEGNQQWTALTEFTHDVAPTGGIQNILIPD